MSVIAADEIRERQMTTERPMGGEIASCRVEERADGRFLIYVTVSWLPRERLLIKQKSPKDSPCARVWANATLGLRYIREALSYHGIVTCSTSRSHAQANLPFHEATLRKASNSLDA